MSLRSKLPFFFLFLIAIFMLACEGYQEATLPDTLTKTARIFLPEGLNPGQVRVVNADGTVFTPDSTLFEVKVRRNGLSLLGALLPSGSYFLTVATPDDEVVYLSAEETAKALLFLFPGVFEPIPSSARALLNSIKRVEPLSDFIYEVSSNDDYLERTEFTSYYMSAFTELPEEVFPSSEEGGKPFASAEPMILSLPLGGSSFDSEDFDLGTPYRFRLSVSTVGNDYVISLDPEDKTGALCFCGVFGIEAIPQGVLSGGVGDSCVDFSLTSALGFFSSLRAFEIAGINDRFVLDASSPALYLLRFSSGSLDLSFGKEPSFQFEELSFLNTRPSIREIHFKGFELNLIWQIVSFLRAFGLSEDEFMSGFSEKEEDIKAVYETLLASALSSFETPCLNPLYSELVNLLYGSLPDDGGVFSYLKRFYLKAGRDIASRIDVYPMRGVLRDLLFGEDLYTPLDTLIISVGGGEIEESYKSISSLLEKIRSSYNAGDSEGFNDCLADDFLFNGIRKADFFNSLSWKDIESVWLLRDGFSISGGAIAEGDVLIEYRSSAGYLRKVIYRLLFAKREGKWLLLGNRSIAETCLRFWETMLSGTDRPAYLIEAWVEEKEAFPLKGVKLLLPGGSEIDLTKEEGGDIWKIPDSLAYEQLFEGLGSLLYLGSSLQESLEFKLILETREGVKNEYTLEINDPLSSEEIALMSSAITVEGNEILWSALSLPSGFYPWKVVYLDSGSATELNYYDESFYFEGSSSPALCFLDLYSKTAILLDTR